MSKIQSIAIIGRPNVGKSKLFNQLIDQNKATVDDHPGLTRDRLYGKGEWLGFDFEVIDTGGYELSSEDPIKKHIREQVHIAIDQADIIFFIVDGRTGLMEIDYQITEMLRTNTKPIFLLVNKCDNKDQEHNVADFYELGYEYIFPISAIHKRGVSEVLDEVILLLKETESEEEENDSIQVAIAGQQNVGKSTLVNVLSGHNRVIACNIPGTTRDSVDTPIKVEGHPYTLIDTAGLKRRAKIEEGVEKLAAVSTLLAIRKADVVILMIDATKGIVSQDKKIAGYIEEQGKACVIAVNKWDLLESDQKRAQEFKKEIEEKLYFIKYAPVLFTSATEKRNLIKIFREVLKVYDGSGQEIGTPELNKEIGKFLERRPPNPRRGKFLKFYYATQLKKRPPTFILFINQKKLLHYSYERYLRNQFRKKFTFYGSPIRLIFRNRS